MTTLNKNKSLREQICLEKYDHVIFERKENRVWYHPICYSGGHFTNGCTHWKDGLEKPSTCKQQRLTSALVWTLNRNGFHLEILNVRYLTWIWTSHLNYLFGLNVSQEKNMESTPTRVCSLEHLPSCALLQNFCRGTHLQEKVY